MLQVQPKVYLIARPQTDDFAISQYLDDVGAHDRPAGVVDLGNQYDGEVLTEFAGRLCYRSWMPGLNSNVTRVRSSINSYLNNILRSRHGSVLEHSYFVFILRDVSRVFTHELVRHRVGTSFSQESLRYVRLDDIKMWIPEWAQQDEELYNRCVWLVHQMEEHQKWMAEHFDLDEEASFDEKKSKTSFMRRFAPEGLATDIVFGANVRSLRHIIEMRTNEHAEEEMRLVFGMIADIITKEAPALFQDFNGTNSGEWIPDYSKV